MHCDLLVIGAGPAGMAAAVKASDMGLSVKLLDEQPECGGQVYRSIGSVAEKRPEDLSILGPDYSHGKNLVLSLGKSNVDYQPQASVWNIDPRESRVLYSSKGRSYSLTAHRILIATGAMERPIPIPGWTLAGVMGAGGAQIALKSTGMIPDGPVVLAGSGPLLLLTAAQLHSVGAQISAVVETTSFRDYLAGAKGALQALVAPEYLLKGLKMRHQLHKAKIPIFSGCRDMRAVGDTNGRLKSFQFRTNNKTINLDVSTLLLHEGVIPNTALSRLSEVDHEWCELQKHWQPRVSTNGNTSISNIMIAGDGAGILGAKAAEYSGRITALNIAKQLNVSGGSEYKTQLRRLRLARWRQSMVRPLLDELFAPIISQATEEDSILCRCYEVSQRDITESIRNGCNNPDEVKALLRCGMGPCQGRMCSSSVSNVIAKLKNQSMKDVGVYRSRPPIKPVTLNELASLQPAQNDH